MWHCNGAAFILSKCKKKKCFFGILHIDTYFLYLPHSRFLVEISAALVGKPLCYSCDLSRLKHIVQGWLFMMILVMGTRLWNGSKFIVHLVLLQYAKSIILYSSLLVPYLPDLQLLSGLFARLYLQPSRLQKCRVMPVSSGHGGFKACCGWNMVCTRFPGPSSLLHRGLTVPVLMGGQSLYISACVHKNVRVHTYTVISRCRQTIGALGKTVSVLCIFILSSSAV